MNKERLYDYAGLKLAEIKTNFENLKDDLDFSNNLDISMEEFQQIIHEFVLETQKEQAK